MRNVTSRDQLQSTGQQHASLYVFDPGFRGGVTVAGMQQVLTGEMVASVGDRVRLAQLVRSRLGLTTEQGQSKIGLLVPAVQAVRQTGSDASHQQILHSLGVSPLGSQQFLAGLPVVLPDDRRLLARVVALALDPASRGHAGGVNAMLMDGSVRFVQHSISPPR